MEGPVHLVKHVVVGSTQQHCSEQGGGSGKEEVRSR